MNQDELKAQVGQAGAHVVGLVEAHRGQGLTQAGVVGQGGANVLATV